jgi:L-xylulokinase
VKILYFLGLDAGTTAIKCVAFNEAGEELAISRRDTTLLYPAPDRVEQDMTEIWNAAREVLRETLQYSKISPEEIAAIGITGQAGGTLLIDDAGNPLKMISWRDLRTSELVTQWEREGRGSEFYDITGWPIWPQHASVHLAWLAKNDPALLKQASTAFSCVDWVTFRLTGERRAAASSLNGIISIKTGRYSDELFRLCELEQARKLFPDIVEPWEAAGTVSAKAANETGLRVGTPVVSTGYDVANCTAGAYGIAKGRAVSVLGTAGTNVVVCDEPVQDPKRSLICAYHIVPHRWLAISEAMSATPNLNWFIDQFCEEEKRKAEGLSKSVHAFWDELVQNVPAGSGGVIYHPYLSGETGPFMKLNAKASFFGISNLHTKHHLLRSVYEGIGYSVRHNFSHLESNLKTAGVTFDRIVLVGGGARSNVWCQMLADIFNKTVCTTRGSEPGCIGAAMSAAVAVGSFGNHEDAASKFVRLKDTFEPEQATAAHYDKLFDVYKSLCASYDENWDRLTKATNQ